MRPPSPEIAAKGAQLIFEGIVRSENAPSAPPSDGSLPPTNASRAFEFEILKVWKGDQQQGELIKIFTADNSAMCGRVFQLGEQYLIYTNQVEVRRATESSTNEVQWRDNSCSRSRRISEATEDLSFFRGDEHPNAATPPAQEPPEKQAPVKSKSETPKTTTPNPPPPTAPTGRFGCQLNHGNSPGPFCISLLLVMLAARRRKMTL